MAAALTLGLLHAGCFAPQPWPLAALAPLQLIIWTLLPLMVWRARSPRQAAWVGASFGMAHFSLGLYWLYISMHEHGGLPALLAALAVLLFAGFLAAFYAGAAAASRAAAGSPDAPRPSAWRLPLTWAACWTLAEWLRGTLLTGFPWLGLGYGQVDSPLAGWAPVAGLYGISWLLAFAGAALALAMLALFRTDNPLAATNTRRARAAATRPALLAVALACAGIGLDQTAWTQPDGDALAVRLVQGNVPQSLKFDPGRLLDGIVRYQQLSGLPPQAHEGAWAGRTAPQLAVLPETVMPLFQDQFADHIWQSWIDLAAAGDSTLVMGAPLRDPGQGRYTNSTLALDGGTSVAALRLAQPLHRYDKHHLVPFGEFIPPGFRWFVRAMHIPLGDFDRGEPAQPPLSLGGQHLAMNICYEDVFGEEIIRAVRDTPASILVNVSNLGWFGESWALRQHLRMARLRAKETGRPMLRATNTGVTAHIAPDGQVLASLPAHRAGVLDVSVQGMTGLTPYTRWGNLPIVLWAIATLVAPAVRRRRRTTA